MAKTTEKFGPAPLTGRKSKPKKSHDDGIALRDLFAMQIVSGMVEHLTQGTNAEAMAAYSRRAYRLADALLVERDKERN